MRFFNLFLCLLITAAPAAQGQVRWMFHAGAGIPYSTSRALVNASPDYYFDYKKVNKLSITPQAGVAIRINAGKKLVFESGINYTWKDYRTAEKMLYFSSQGNLQHSALFDFRTRLHYISFPFTLSYNLQLSPKSALQFGAGINYAFLVAAGRRYVSRQNSGTGPTEDRFVENVVVAKGLIQTSQTPKGALNIFDTGLKLQISYIYRSRWMLRAFHEHSLYSIYLKQATDKPDLSLRYTGLSIGYIL